MLPAVRLAFTSLHSILAHDLLVILVPVILPLPPAALAGLSGVRRHRPVTRAAERLCRQMRDTAGRCETRQGGLHKQLAGLLASGGFLSTLPPCTAHALDMAAPLARALFTIWSKSTSCSNPRRVHGSIL